MQKCVLILSLIGLILCGTVVDNSGNVYQTIQIGDQIWMTENLKVNNYNNGDEMPLRHIYLMSMKYQSHTLIHLTL